MNQLKHILVGAGIIALLMALMQSCYYDNAEELYPAPTTNACDPDSTLSYASCVASIIETTCAVQGCHVSGNPPRVPLTNHAEVKSAIDNLALRNRVANRSMPKGRSLTQNQIDRVLNWIDQGALNN